MTVVLTSAPHTGSASSSIGPKASLRGTEQRSAEQGKERVLHDVLEVLDVEGRQPKEG